MENLQTQTQPQPHNQTLHTDQHQHQHPPVAVVECPRCNSMNTKFCYYNNYNLSQPRHFCKNCRRYWTKGGALRNIPVGGGTRKNSKRATSAQSKRPTKTVHVSSGPQAQSVSSEADHPLLLDCGVGMGVGSFSSLLASNGNLSNFCHGSFLGGVGSGEGGGGEVTSSSVESGGIGNDADALWPGSWADLSIYTPGPTFQ